jgi:hypothetical protein
MGTRPGPKGLSLTGFTTGGIPSDLEVGSTGGSYLMDFGCHRVGASMNLFDNPEVDLRKGLSTLVKVVQDHRQELPRPVYEELLNVERLIQSYVSWVQARIDQKLEKK